MDATRTIQHLAMLSLLVMSLTLASLFFFESSLPPLLQEFNQQQSISTLKSYDLFMALLELFIGLLHILALIGLIKVQRWARSLFLYTIFAGIGFMIFVDPVVVADVYTGALSYGGCIVDGMLISLLFFNKSDFFDVQHREPVHPN